MYPVRQFPARRMSVMVALQEEIEDLCSYDTANNKFSIRQRHCAADRAPASFVRNNHDDFNFESRGHMTTFYHKGNILIPAWFPLYELLRSSQLSRELSEVAGQELSILASRPARIQRYCARRHRTGERYETGSCTMTFSSIT